MRPAMWFVCGALLAGTAVANGAYAAHGLQSRLLNIYQNQPQLIGERFAQYETGVRYQMYHAFAIMLVGIVGARKATLLTSLAGLSFFFGTLFFSGMLYLLVMLNQPTLGRIVPIGGGAFLIGWFALAIGGAGALRELVEPKPEEKK